MATRTGSTGANRRHNHSYTRGCPIQYVGNLDPGETAPTAVFWRAHLPVSNVNGKPEVRKLLFGREDASGEWFVGQWSQWTSIPKPGLAEPDVDDLTDCLPCVDKEALDQYEKVRPTYLINSYSIGIVVAVLSGWHVWD